MRLGEESGEILGHRGTDLVDRDQMLPGRALGTAGQFLHRRAPIDQGMIIQRQQPRGGLADLADAQPIDEAVEPDPAARLDRVEQFPDRLLAPAHLILQGQQLRPALPVGQGEDVGGRFDAPGLVEELGILLAQALDVEGVARGEMDQTLDDLRFALQAAGAAANCFALGLHRQAAANVAMILRLPFGQIAGPFFEHHLDHLRDDVAGALDHHPIAGAEILALDLVLIVQGRPADHDTAHRHRLQHGIGGDRAGAADIGADFQQLGDRPLGGEFMGDGPARAAADLAQALLPVEPVDLVDHAVDVVGQAGAVGAQGVTEIAQLGGAVAHLGARIDLEAPGAELFEKFPMGSADRLADFALGVAEQRQGPGGGDGGIELAQRAGRRVARIGEQGLLAGLGALLVQTEEIGARHINLAAHLQHRRRRALQGLRQILQGLEIGGDVLALDAVAARGALDETAILVAQADRQPVDLRLGDEFDHLLGGQAEKAADLGLEINDILVAEGIVERQHRPRMAHLAETLGRRRADLAARAVLAHQLGKALLDGDVAQAKRVILGVRGQRRVLLVIGDVELVDLRGQTRQFLGGLLESQILDSDLGSNAHVPTLD